MPTKKSGRAPVPAVTAVDPAMRRVQKQERFLRIANRRVNQALKYINLIGNLSNRSSYAFELEQVDKIALALAGALDSAMGRFRNAPDTKQTFSL